MVSKMEALLAEANRPWSYLDGIIKRMLGEVKPLAWLNDEQVRKVLQMLIIDATRAWELLRTEQAPSAGQQPSLF
ncbi:hypothetical protein [Serratia symbiotica]|uniref:hypothetical protein n=1 Tax=Serratia symbiotica TaxID=138074 RepID=UPI0033133ECC